MSQFEFPDPYQRSPMDDLPATRPPEDPDMIDIGQGIQVDRVQLEAALQEGDGVMIGRCGMDPYLADQFAQYHEDPRWRQLARPPLTLTRMGDTWHMDYGYEEDEGDGETDGFRRLHLSKEMLEGMLAGTYRLPDTVTPEDPTPPTV